MFSSNNIENVCYHAGSMVMQAGVGCFSAQLINGVNQYLNPGKVILGRAANIVIEPWNSCAAMAIFVIVDLIAKVALDQLPFKDILQKPFYQFVRMAVSVTISSLIASAALGISFNIAALAIVTSIVSSTIILGIAKLYTHLTEEFPKLALPIKF